MGKSSSKLKKKDRSQSIIWSFKFPSLGTLTRRKMVPVSGPHMEVKPWLAALDLTQYASLFEKYNGVEDLLSFTESDIKELGVKNSAHRASIVSSLVVLKKKYNKGNKTDKSQRHSVALDGARRIDQASNAADLVLVSNVIQSKSLCNITMDVVSDGGLDAGGLRKALEWELSLDSRDLRSHAWYHGAIPRTRAEEIVERDGDFLVRDCASQPGNYVLSTRWKGQTLHFVINKVILAPDTVYERIQFQFEDEPYDTVSDLITYYVGSGKPISALSGAKIQSPKNRLHPLSFYATRYSRQSQASPRYNTLQRDAPPRLPSKTRCHTLAPEEKANSADGVVKSGKLGPSSLQRKQIARVTSDPALSPCFERRSFSTDGDAPDPPPKPSRLPTMNDSEESTRGYSGSDSGNGSGDSAQSSADATTPCGTGTIVRGVVIKNPRYRYAYDTPIPTSASSMTLTADYDFPLPLQDPLSYFDLENYHTLLLPTLENKPVDPAALQCVRSLLQDTGSRVLANHLTRMDLEVTVAQRSDTRFSLSGLELSLLPHGKQARRDLIERTECTKLLVAVSILTCSTEDERAEAINKWIQVAVDTKTALGNLFGFCSIMLGLCLPQVQRLSATWHVLRQKFTDSAFSYEAKLRPTLKNMNECTNPQAPNTTIPHILPLVLLQERTVDDILGRTPPDALTSVCITPCETSADLGLTTMLAHLDAGRRYAGALTFFRRNAEIVLGDSKVDPLLLDVFRTEFLLKFLWGSRGASVSASERHAKFQQVLSLMSEKCEQSIGTAV